MTPRSVLVLVDAFSTGALLARHAADRYRLLHVRSRQDMPAAFAGSLPRELFEDDLTYPDDVDGVVRRVARRAPVAVIAASEFGVEVADELANALGLRGNDPALSTARRDKARMMEVLRARGVRTPRQLRGTRVAELVAWRRAEGLARVVVKPVDSAGSDDVYTCDTDEEIAAAFDTTMGKRNLMMRTNDAVLVQEHLCGEEFVVNSVSRDGRHWFTDAWVSRKAVLADKRAIYDHEDLLPPDDPDLDVILPYVADVLDALGIREGPAHTELVLTADGPCLLETAARVSGLANPPALDRATGADQVGLTLECYAPDATALTSRRSRYPRLAAARCVNLIARREVPLPSAVFRAALTELPAFESLRFRIADGARTRRTVDLNSSPGVAFFVHRDQGEIDKAYELLRGLEHELL
ncbi:ATP-grasp domain-containing protein [Umezawaea sp.]|uniref:ATP-grasp domain-containing protein n=1 Tax=Umezawaea sp. TaxID=1955258 RepID=UPI002ED3735F